VRVCVPGGGGGRGASRMLGIGLQANGRVVCVCVSMCACSNVSMIVPMSVCLYVCMCMRNIYMSNTRLTLSCFCLNNTKTKQIDLGGIRRSGQGACKRRESF
jgi:hypothetical protein